MALSDPAAILTGVAVLIGNAATAYVVVTKSHREAQEAKEDRARRDAELKAHLHQQDEKLVALHASTNGLSKRAEDLALLLGKAVGKAEEKSNPTP
jgi:ribulose kinase